MKAAIGFLLASLAASSARAQAAPDAPSPAPAAEASPSEAVAPAPSEAVAPPPSETNAPPASASSEAPPQAPPAQDAASAPAVAVEEQAKPIERGSFYLGLGFGIGASGLADNSLGNTPLSGSLGLRMGGIISNQYLVGVEIELLGQFAEWKEKTTTGAALSAILLDVTTFPVASLPLNVTVGGGWGSAVKLARIADTSKGDPKVVTASGNGAAWLGAVGWDLFPGDGANLSLQLRYEGLYSSDLGVDHTAALGVWLQYY